MCFFFLCYFFENIVSSTMKQTLKWNFFSLLNHSGPIFKYCFKNSFVYDCKFLEKIKKSENSLNFFFYHYQGFSKSLRGNEKFWKVQYSRCLQLDNLFGPIVTSTLNSHQFWRIRSTIVNQNFQWSKSYHTLTFSYLIFYL